MEVTPTYDVGQVDVGAGDTHARRLGRLRLALSSAAAAALGALPHILHHAGPLAGAAIFAGVGGSLLFGALGLVATVPFLVRMRRRCGNWRRPLVALTVFAAVFSLSTFVVGPALTGSSEENPPTQSSPAKPSPSEHKSHH